MKFFNEAANLFLRVRNIGVVNLKQILWESVSIIYKFLYYIGSLFSCLSEKRPADDRLAFQISVGLTDVQKGEKKTP